MLFQLLDPRELKPDWSESVLLEDVETHKTLNVAPEYLAGEYRDKLGAHLASLRKDPHVVVGTPGRIQELIGKNALALGKVNTLVLDEADRMAREIAAGAFDRRLADGRRRIVSAPVAIALRAARAPLPCGSAHTTR